MGVKLPHNAPPSPVAMGEGLGVGASRAGRWRGISTDPLGSKRATRSTHRGPGTGLAIHDMFRR